MYNWLHIYSYNCAWPQCKFPLTHAGVHSHCTIAFMVIIPGNKIKPTIELYVPFAYCTDERGQDT